MTRRGTPDLGPYATPNGPERPRARRGRLSYEFAADVTVYADPATAFDWFQTPANWMNLPEVIDTKGSGLPGGDNRFVWRQGTIEYEVLVYDPPHRAVIAWSQPVQPDLFIHRHVRVTEAVEYRPLPGGTHVAVTLVAASTDGRTFGIRNPEQFADSTVDRFRSMAQLLNKRHGT